jgi:hypothetical protein
LGLLGLDFDFLSFERARSCEADFEKPLASAADFVTQRGARVDSVYHLKAESIVGLRHVN